MLGAAGVSVKAMLYKLDIATCTCNLCQIGMCNCILDQVCRYCTSVVGTPMGALLVWNVCCEGNMYI